MIDVSVGEDEYVFLDSKEFLDQLKNRTFYLSKENLVPHSINIVSISSISNITDSGSS
jgi:hypothetical protein